MKALLPGSIELTKLKSGNGLEIQVRSHHVLLGTLSMGSEVAIVAWSRAFLAVHDRIDIVGGLVIGVGIGVGVAGLAAAQGWQPGGLLAWALIAGLAGLVFAISVWERRKRADPP